MIFKDRLTGLILYKQYVQQETNKLYLQGIEEIIRRGMKVKAIICDRRKGLFQLFDQKTLMQFFNFHQVVIIRRYLTKKPVSLVGVPTNAIKVVTMMLYKC